ncbi:hypothetical protein [Desulfuribacillus stibiiarsenatis]|uniref:hypothetical protein n=1 Tax=Desulfuribacillus stibiiarsenatis TaxID=1390249 RepID=UPI00159F012F|nr:hypothetical protein [Desulfuribacillus stibiiarsenatis]
MNQHMEIDLYNSWRVVIGASRSINGCLNRIRPYEMDQNVPKWILFQYSLLRVDMFLHSMNLKFLRNGDYSITSEERQQLESVIKVYETIRDEYKSESNSPVSFIDLLSEQMMIIDEHYTNTIEVIKGF